MRLLSTILLVWVVAAAQAQETSRTQVFDKDWRFHRGGAQGAEKPEFNDSAWRMIDLPHDWSIEDLPGTASPFSPDAVSQVSGGFTTGGIGWYRKTFTIPAAQQDKKVQLLFDGVYMNAEVWLNGKRLGKHPYGYTAFWYDITERVKFGQKNVVSVKIKNEGENSRWYAGSGIYRHVWMTVVNPVHTAQWGTYITTPQVSAATATVHIATKVMNETAGATDVKIITHLVDAAGKEVASNEATQQIATKATAAYDQDIKVAHPALWNVEKPILYTAVTEIYRDGQLADRTQTPFGIRSITADAVNGFRLNGVPLKLKGGCVHHDNGPLGARAYDRAEERKVALLKASGFNAIRCAHNPPSPAFLDACDRLGMLVIDEAFDIWTQGKNPEDYHLYFNEWWQRDLESMLYRDRNHPSIIMWSTGNEIPNREKPEVVKVARMLSDFIHSVDSTRFVTCGVNGVTPDKDPFLATLDIAGYNYARDKYDSDHLRLPTRVMFATESLPLEAFDYWMGVKDHAWVIGDFVWTAFDYIGEASIGWLGYWQTQNFYPWNLAYCGDIDICGWKRPQSYYRDVLWQPNQISVFVKPPQPSFPINPQKVDWSHWEWHDVLADWNWHGHENQPLEVEVYASCEEVGLFLNGRLIGKKPTNRSNKFTANWQVPYQPGELKAIGYNGNKAINSAVLRTAGTPVQLQLSADRTTIRANEQDLSYITIELQDKEGVRDPKAANEVQFSIEGPGVIVGVGNANPVSTESYQLPKRKAWQGRCLVIVKSMEQRGDIVLTASAAGIKDKQVIIKSE